MKFPTLERSSHFTALRGTALWWLLWGLGSLGGLSTSYCFTIAHERTRVGIAAIEGQMVAANVGEAVPDESRTFVDFTAQFSLRPAESDLLIGVPRQVNLGERITLSRYEMFRRGATKSQLGADRHQLNLGGTYQGVKAFVADLIDRYPNGTVSSLRLERHRDGTDMLVAQVTFTIWYAPVSSVDAAAKVR